jgi:polyisoprenyl-phosphate glycosyltransferase
MSERAKPLVTFVVPVLNEEANISPLYKAVQHVMHPLRDRYDYELLFTDNHSTDQTFQRLEHLARHDPRVRVLRFSRNFGYQRSIFTGYINACGDVAIQLDCDLQDPPALIPEFLAYWEQGYRVVYGVRRSRQEGWGITWTRKIFYRLIDRLSDDELPHDAGDFRLVDRAMLDVLRQIDDHHPYLRGIIAASGFRQIGIPYDREERKHGVTKFSFRALLTLAIDGILSHSIVPLRIATFTGLFISLATFLLSMGYIISRLSFGVHWPRGFATLTVLILLSLSMNAIFLGIIGEYLGRIYQQVKKRPMTIVEQAVNMGPASLPDTPALPTVPEANGLEHRSSADGQAGFADHDGAR